MQQPLAQNPPPKNHPRKHGSYEKLRYRNTALSAQLIERTDILIESLQKISKLEEMILKAERILQS